MESAKISIWGTALNLDGGDATSRLGRRVPPIIRRVARIWKRGGYFERVRKVQTNLTQIFIVVESKSHGLSENSDEISRKARKFEAFFRPKSGGLQKKKRSSSILRLIFRPNSEIQTFEGGCFPMGGGASKALKTCDFAYFTSQWGGSSPPPPPPPPWLRY